MMRGQNVSVNDALGICCFSAPRNAHDTPTMLGLLRVFAQVSLLLNSAVGFARPLHHCSKRVACSQLALLHTVAAVRGCDPLSDQVRQAGSVVEGEVGVGRMWAELCRSPQGLLEGAATALTCRNSCGQNRRCLLLWLEHKFCLSPVQSVNG